MIEGFSEYTHDPLTAEDEDMLNILVFLLGPCVGPKRAITNARICQDLHQLGFNAKPARIRKIIHEIRIKRLIDNLVATSTGYYICTNDDDIKRYIISILQRASSIREVAEVMMQTNHLDYDDLDLD